MTAWPIKRKNFEVTAQYQFDFGLRPAISYLQSKGKDLYNNGRYADKDLVKYMDVGATYYFNRNMSTYVDYKINLLDGNDKFYEDNGISTDNIVALGLVLPVLMRLPAGSGGLSPPASLQIKQNAISRGLK